MVVLTSPPKPGPTRRLACMVLGHDPAPGAVWNRGYAFAHCARCGTPILRAVFGGWRTPPAGCRIVWPGRVEQPARAAASPPAARRDDFMSDHAAAPTPRAAPPVMIGDFMSDDTGGAPPAPSRRVG